MLSTFSRVALANSGLSLFFCGATSLEPLRRGAKHRALCSASSCSCALDNRSCYQQANTTTTATAAAVASCLPPTTTINQHAPRTHHSPPTTTNQPLSTTLHPPQAVSSQVRGEALPLVFASAHAPRSHDLSAGGSCIRPPDRLHQL